MNKKVAPHYDVNWQFFEKILTDQNVMEDIHEIKHKYGIPLDGFKGKPREMRLWNRNLIKNIPLLRAFHQEIRTMLQRHNIPLHWTDTLTDHLKYGWNLVPMNNVLGLDIAENNGSKEIVIRCSATTRLTDIKAIWKTVEMLQRKLPDYQAKSRARDLQTFERDKLISKLHNEGKSVKEIAYQLSEASSEEKYQLTEDSIRQAIKRANRTAIKRNKSQD